MISMSQDWAITHLLSEKMTLTILAVLLHTQFP